MKMIVMPRLLCVVASWFAWSMFGSAHAAWPEKPITIVAPWPPGGNADIQARLVAQILNDALGSQTVLVENRPGAGGMVGARSVARTDPDGHTFMIGALAHVLGEFFYKNKLLDIRQDLVAVTQISSIPNYIVVAPGSKYHSLQALFDVARENPDTVTCAVPGIGTVAHLVCEQFNQQLGIRIPIVPYRGGAAAITDVIGGQVTFFAGNEGLPFIRDGRLKGLAVTSLQRSALAPEIAPVSELLSGYDISSWYGLFAPAGTSPEVVARVSQIVTDALTQPAIKERLAALGATPVGGTPATFGAFVNAEFDRWAQVAKSLNIRLD